MVDFNQVSAALKQAHGLPTQAVNTEGSSAAPSNLGEPNATPVQQNKNVAQILQSVGNEAPTQPSEVERILAAKDKALEASSAQIEQLNNAQQEMYKKLEEFMGSQAQTPANAPEPQINLPGLPDNIDDLPAEDQLKTALETVNQLKSSLAEELKNRDQNLKNMLGPLAFQVNEMRQMKDKTQVVEQYPAFEYDKYKPDMDKLRAEVPQITALEAAQIIAAKNDPKMLLPVEADAPVTMPTRPSMEAASGTRGPTTTAEANNKEGEINSQLMDAIVGSHRAGNTSQAHQLTDALLKRKVSNIFGNIG